MRDLASARHREIAWTIAAQILLLGGFLALWEFASGRYVDAMLVSSPSAIWAQAVKWIGRGTLQREAFSTLWVVLAGLAVGGSAGLVVGILAGISPRLNALINPFVTIAFALPKVALIPLFILWFGTGDAQKLALTIVTVFFFFFFSGLAGARAVPQAVSNALLLYGATRWQRLRLLHLPAMSSWFLAGLRVATPYAFVAVIGAEVVSSTGGLGHLAKTNAAAFNGAGAFAAIVTLTLLGAGFGWIASWFAQRHSRRGQTHVN